MPDNIQSPYFKTPQQELMEIQAKIKQWETLLNSFNQPKPKMKWYYMRPVFFLALFWAVTLFEGFLMGLLV